jgi:hypothetical protein
MPDRRKSLWLADFQRPGQRRHRAHSANPCQQLHPGRQQRILPQSRQQLLLYSFERMFSQRSALSAYLFLAKK